MGKRPNFQISVTINELTNLPQVSGMSWTRWFIKDSPKPEARGKTDKHIVRDHKVSYGSYKLSTTHHIRVSSRTNTLRPCVLVLEVVWEHSNSAEKIPLGRVEVNLSEFANQENPQPTRFLLKDSKINSTLSLTIELKQISGTKSYTVPEATSRVFGDISTTLNNDSGHGLGDAKLSIDSLANSSFSVQWHSVIDGDYHPRTCINDIFNGGDGVSKCCFISPESNGSAIKKPQGNVSGDGKPTIAVTRRDSHFPQRRLSISQAGEGTKDSLDINHERNEMLNDLKIRPLLLSEEDMRDDLSSWHITHIAA